MKIKLKAEKRELVGRKVKQLRKQGKIPANVFGKNVDSQSLTVDKKEFSEIYKQAGETQIIDLDGRPVLVSNIQLDPISGETIHVDFRQVDLKEEIKANVPLVFEGDSPAEKQNLGTVVHQLDEVEVEALPTSLPEKIIVDVTILAEVDQAIYVKDLKVGSDVKITNDAEAIVAKVEPPQEEVAEEAPAQEVAEGTTPTENTAETQESPKE